MMKPMSAGQTEPTKKHEKSFERNTAAVNKIKQTYCLQRFMLDWRHQHYKLVFFLTSSIVTMFTTQTL